MSWKPPTRELLRGNDIRPTPRRVALLDALITAARPIAADELHARVKKVDLVTVYRTLESFVTADLVREVRFKDDVVRYELAERAQHHHHLVCTRCNRVDELPDCNLHALEASVLKRSKNFISVDEHALEFFGTCVTCAKR